jgi:hypothetical protein
MPASAEHPGLYESVVVHVSEGSPRCDAGGAISEQNPRVWVFNFWRQESGLI